MKHREKFMCMNVLLNHNHLRLLQCLLYINKEKLVKTCQILHSGKEIHASSYWSEQICVLTATHAGSHIHNWQLNL